MDQLTTLAGETRTRLLRLIRARPLPVSEIAESLGITTNAVRGHLTALERDGLVRPAGMRPSTGGKPARTYELTTAAEELFPKAYALVFTELLSTLREVEGEGATIDLLRRVGRRLGARATTGAAAPAVEDGARRVAAAAALLESIGGSVEVSREAEGWRIDAAGCPLSGVVAESPDVCSLAESLVGEVTGRRVVECCDRSARPRCSFRVLDESAPTP